MERKERILVAFGEKGLGRQYTIGPDCKIGRLADCQVQILDTQVSKHHARIFAGAEAEAGTYFIEDLGRLPAPDVRPFVEGDTGKRGVSGRT